MEWKIGSILILMILFSGCVSESVPNGESIAIITSNGPVKIQAEIADEPEERQTGLMFRDELGESSGMLFIFPYEAITSFWMKNTKIPLDMIFISSDWTITEIKRDIQPCISDPCPTYPSEYPTKYVLEVNAGFSEKNGVRAGDKINLENLKD